MTADIESGDELMTLATLMTTYILPALKTANTSPALENTLTAELAAVRQGPSRVNPAGDRRMIPSAAPVATPIPFRP